MEWTELAPGIYTKMLNHNEVTGERTAMFRFRPKEGAAPPSICHYHSVPEEIFMLEGKMTFDHETWLGKFGYVYHPPFAVHGFNSAIPEETIFIGRGPAELDVNYPDPGAHKAPYYINGEIPDRPLTYLNPLDDRSWSRNNTAKYFTDCDQIVLSEDPVTGEGSALVKLKTGAQVSAPNDRHDTYLEGLVLSGQIKNILGQIFEQGDYWHIPPEAKIADLIANKDTVIFISYGLDKAA